MNLIEDNKVMKVPMLTILGREILSLRHKTSPSKFDKVLGAYLSEPDLSEAERSDLLYIKNEIP